MSRPVTSVLGVDNKWSQSLPFLLWLTPQLVNEVQVKSDASFVWQTFPFVDCHPFSGEKELGAICM